MSARDRLIAYLRQSGLSTPRAEANLDAFAHELAERIREAGAYWGEWAATGKAYRAAADIIDPQQSAGLVRPGEEPT